MPQDLATIGALIGDATRACILSALLTGEYLAAGELARRAKVTPQTVSSHLARLVEGGLLTVVVSGRHRYYGLRDAEVAHALEAFSSIAPLPAKPRTLRDSMEIRAFRQARTCYDHLAGQLGVLVTRSMLNKGWLLQHGETFEITDAGKTELSEFGLAIETLLCSKHVFARICIDWTERLPHLSGAVGAALTQQFFERKWIERLPHSRALRITERGFVGLHAEFQISILHT